jgi:N utilization substance protein B
MTNRSRAREVALQLLFQRDHNSHVERQAIEAFALDRLRDPALQQFCLALYDGVIADQGAIDERITAAAENWRLARMAVVDRNILRLGAHELLSGGAAGVVLDEAIEMARRYGSSDSPAFINGVLDRLRQDASASGVPATEQHPPS